MNYKSDKNVTNKSNTLVRGEHHDIDLEKADERGRALAQTQVATTLRSISSQNHSIGTLYFGTSYRATSPKTQELMTRHAATGATSGDSFEADKILKC